jgi:uncharacterized membrane protein YfhO
MYTLEREAGDYKLYSDNFESESGSYKLYSANYQLPFAMTVSASFANEDVGGDWVSLHNKFYKALTGDTQDLVTGISNSVKVSDTVLEYTAKVDGYGAVYMNIVDVNNRDSDANASWLISSMHIYVNDEPVVIPTLGDVENTAYFTDYNNNLVYLGCFKDELINIRVEYDDAWFLKVSEVSFAQLNMDKMQSLCDMYKDSQCEVTYTNDSLTVKVNGTATNNYALIPVIYSDNWTVTVDGQEVSAREIAGLFTGVKIHSGENTIVFKFEAKGKREGTLISFAVILILLVCLIINHFKKIKMPAWIEYCALFVYLQLYNAVIVFMFLIPVLCSIPALIYQLVMKIM